MSGKGRGRGVPKTQPGPGILPISIAGPSRPNYRPAGGSSDESDDDELEMIGVSIPLKSGTGIGIPVRSSTSRAGSLPSPSSHGGYFFTPSPEGGPTGNWGSGARPSKPNPVPAGASSSRYPVRPPKHNSLPFIPYVNKDRATVALKSINTAWNNGPRDIFASGISRTLRTEFREAENPYSMALYLMAYSMDFFGGKNSMGVTLSQEVIRELKNWVTEFGQEGLEKAFLNHDLQLTVFHVMVKQRNDGLFRTVFDLFRLERVKKDLVGPIKSLAAEGLYREACLSATVLGLFNDFDIHEFVIPLILQDREADVLNFLAGSVTLQTGLISYLDSILGEASPAYSLRRYALDKKIERVNYDKMDTRPLGNLLKRITTRFNLSAPAVTPNMTKKNRLGSLRFLVQRKYDGVEPMVEAAFQELLDSIIQKDVSMAEEAIYCMRSRGDVVGAAKCALRNSVPPTSLVHEVQVEMARLDPGLSIPSLGSGGGAQAWDEDWEVPAKGPSPPPAKKSPSKKALSPTAVSVPEGAEGGYLHDQTFVNPIDLPEETRPGTYYKSPLPITNIHVLDTPELLDVFLQNLRAAQMALLDGTGVLAVGFDCEWKPLMSEQPGVALIQVALPDDIFLIDTFKLRPEKAKGGGDRLGCLLKHFFGNPQILKIGYGLQSDMRMLARTTPSWEKIGTGIKTVLDLSSLSKELLKINPEFYPIPTSGSNIGGLSELVRVCTGLLLNKDEQFSNWEKRPLRDSQIVYAATDAYCLLDVFDMMKRRAADLEINFEQLLKQFVNKGGGKVEKDKALSTTDLLTAVASNGRPLTALPRESPFREPRGVKALRLVCDNMLQGLGKQLRACGVDTLILTNQDSHARAAHFALQDERCILTRGQVYSQLSSYVPIGHCYAVVSDPLVDQLREVLAYFNVVVTNSDIYTRCQACNENAFHRVSGGHMKELAWLYGRTRDLEDPGSSSSRTSVLSGSMEIEDEPLPSGSPHVNVLGPLSSRGWVVLPESELTVVSEGERRLVKTKSGATVDHNRIPTQVLEQLDEFYVCSGCGKVYWIGSHYRNVLDGKTKLPIPAESSSQLTDTANQNLR